MWPIYPHINLQVLPSMRICVKLDTGLQDCFTLDMDRQILKRVESTFLYKSHNKHLAHSWDLELKEEECFNTTIQYTYIESDFENTQWHNNINGFLFYNVCIVVQVHYKSHNMDVEQNIISKTFAHIAPGLIANISCEYKSIPIRMIPLSLEVTMSHVTGEEWGLLSLVTRFSAPAQTHPCLPCHTHNQFRSALRPPPYPPCKLLGNIPANLIVAPLWICAWKCFKAVV